jgi:hypothetical protein
MSHLLLVCYCQEIEASGASKMLVTCCKTAQWHKKKIHEQNFHQHENLKSYQGHG